jgi:hypothetical protein
MATLYIDGECDSVTPISAVGIKGQACVSSYELTNDDEFEIVVGAMKFEMPFVLAMLCLFP